MVWGGGGVVGVGWGETSIYQMDVFNKEKLQHVNEGGGGMEGGSLATGDLCIVLGPFEC